MTGVVPPIPVTSEKKLKSKSKSKSKKKSKSKPQQDYEEPYRKKKSGKSSSKPSSRDSSKKSSRAASGTATPTDPSSIPGRDVSSLTAKQQRRLKKKEKRLATNEFKKHSRGPSTTEEQIPEPMSAYDDDNRDIVLIDSDSEEEKKISNASTPQSDSEPNEVKTVEKSTNGLINNDDFIGFDFSDDDDDDDEEKERYSDDEATYIPSIRESNDNSDDDYTSDYEEPTLNGKRKAKQTAGPPRKRHEVSSEFPWMNNGQDYASNKEISDWLTKELLDFVAYLSPSEAEIRARNEAVQRMKKLVSGMWSDAMVNVFGSYATDMYLPGSDIDMVITSPSGRLASKTFFHQLVHKLRSNPGHAEHIVPIAKARVPIIKFVDRQSKIHIDLSFERTNGLTAVEHIRKWNQQFPCLRSLVIPIKQFLSHRKLNDVSAGGIGGYSIICTVVSFLSLHPRLSSGMMDPMRNLGPLLIEYFELYGKKFNLDRTAIQMYPQVKYLSKSDVPSLCVAVGRHPASLVIQDPDDKSNNIGRSTYNIFRIRTAFSGAYDILTAKCYELNLAPRSKRRGQSIIGTIIRLKGPARDFLDQRDAVENIAWENQINEDSDGDSDSSQDSYDDDVQNFHNQHNLYESDSDDSDGYDPETSRIPPPPPPKSKFNPPLPKTPIPTGPSASKSNGHSLPSLPKSIPTRPALSGKPRDSAPMTKNSSTITSEESKKMQLRKYFDTVENSDGEDEYVPTLSQTQTEDVGSRPSNAIEISDDEYEPQLSQSGITSPKNDSSIAASTESKDEVQIIDVEPSKVEKSEKMSAKKKRLAYWDQKGGSVETSSAEN